MRSRFGGLAGLVVVFAAVALAPLARAEDQPGADGELGPVPPSWESGSRLVLESAGCSIDAPGPGWRWLCPRQAPPEGLIEIRCQGPTPAARWFLHVEQERLGKLTQELVEDFVEKLDAPYARAHALSLTRVSCEPSDVPIPGRSFRFVNCLRDGKGEALYSHGYVASAHRIFVLGALSSSEVEPPGLATSARSFELLKAPGPGATPVAAPGVPAPRPSIGLVVLVLAIPASVLVAGIIAFAIAWRRRERDEHLP